MLSVGSGFALALAMAAPAAAQSTTGNTTEPAATPTGAATPVTSADVSSSSNPEAGEIVVTGSRLRPSVAVPVDQPPIEVESRLTVVFEID